MSRLSIVLNSIFWDQKIGYQEAFYSVMLHSKPALLAASTPNGEFSTINTSEAGKFVLSKAITKGKGSGFPPSR